MSITICGVGATTPIGLSAAATAAAYQAGISGFASHPDMVDYRGEHMSVAMIPQLNTVPSLIERMAWLARGALNDLRASSPPGSLLQSHLILVTPSSRPGWENTAARQLLALLQEGDLADGNFKSVELVTADHAAIGEVVLLSSKNVQSRPGEVNILLAVESLIEPTTLEWLDGADRLMSDANPFGLIPGEGAACIALATPELARSKGLRNLALVEGLGVSKGQPAPSTTKLEAANQPPPNATEASQAAFAATQTAFENGLRVGQIYVDLTGEPYRADRFGLLLTRCGDRLTEDVKIDVLTNRIGDTGTAFGFLACALAISSCQLGYGNANGVIVCGHSANGRSSALLLSIQNIGYSP